MLAGAALFACGDSQRASPAGASDAAETDGRDFLGPINLADCGDWRHSSEEARRRAIDQIRRFAAGPVPASGGGGAVLAARHAYQLFETTCANAYARGFRLYKLYTRGASLGGP